MVYAARNVLDVRNWRAAANSTDNCRKLMIHQRENKDTNFQSNDGNIRIKIYGEEGKLGQDFKSLRRVKKKNGLPGQQL